MAPFRRGFLFPELNCSCNHPRSMRQSLLYYPNDERGKRRMKYPTKTDPVVLDELRHDRNMELAQEAAEARIDELKDQVRDEVAIGEHDGELIEWLLSYLDPPQLAKIVRNLVDAKVDAELAFSRMGGDMVEAAEAIEEYITDVAKRWAE